MACPNSAPPSDALWTVADAANFIGCDTSTIYRKIRAGELPAVKAGPRLTRVHRRDVLQLLSPFSSEVDR